ncbi:MAG: hypothetical protein U0176_14750 [Bacteroidia bacterium]
MKYNSAVLAKVTVTPSDANSNSLFWNEKSGSEALVVRGDISAGTNYADQVSQDESRMKNSLWAFSKEMKPVVIETTRDKYKAAAKASLGRLRRRLRADAEKPEEIRGERPNH